MLPQSSFGPLDEYFSFWRLNSTGYFGFQVAKNGSESIKKGRQFLGQETEFFFYVSHRCSGVYFLFGGGGASSPPPGGHGATPQEANSQQANESLITRTSASSCRWVCPHLIGIIDLVFSQAPFSYTFHVFDHHPKRKLIEFYCFKAVDASWLFPGMPCTDLGRSSFLVLLHCVITCSS